MNIKEFKNKYKDKLVSLYYTEYKTVDVMDETLINITETKVYEGKAKSIPNNYFEHKIISMRPEFKNKEFFIKLFI